MPQEFDANAAVARYLSGPTPDTTLRASLQEAVGKNPDEVAQWRKTAATLGVPVDTAQAMPDWSRQQEKLAGFNTSALARMNPLTAGFLSNPDNAAIAHDDVDSMTGIEGAIKSLGGAAVDVAKYVTSAPGAMGGGLLKEAGGALGQVAMGATAGVGAGLFDLGGVVNDVIGKPLQALGQPDHYNPFIGMGEAARSQAARTREAITNFTPETDSNIGKGIYSGLQSLGTNLALLPVGVAAGSGSVVAGLMATIAGAKAYTDARISGMEPIGAATYAAPTAAFEYAFEKVPASRLLSDLAKGSSMWKTFTNQLVPEILGEQATTVLQDMNEWLRLNPTKTLSEFVAERPDAAVQTLVATIVGVAGQSAAVDAVGRLSGAREQADRAEKAAAAVESILQLAQNSKLRTRDPESFAQFVQQVAGEGDAPKELFISAETLTNSLNQSGVTMAQLQAFAPEVAAQLQAAAQSPGADIRVPVAELLGVDPAITGPLVDHLREAPDAPSRAEAREYLGSDEGQRIGADVEKELGRQVERDAYQQGVEQVQAQFQTELDAVGRFRPEVNKAFSAMFGNFYAAKAAQANMPIAEFAEKYRLRISGQSAPGAGMYDQAMASQPPEGWEHATDGRSASAMWRGENGAKAVFWTDLNGRLKIDSPDLAGYSHSVGRSTIEHIRKRHGDKSAESSRNQVGIDEADIASIPDIVTQYDAIRTDLRSAQGAQRIAYAKAVDGGVLIYIEDVSRKRSDMRGVTMWKYSGVTDAATVLDTALKVDAQKTKGQENPGLSNDALRSLSDYESDAQTPSPEESIEENGKTFKQSARGQIAFGDDVTQQASVISLFKSADFSTVIHESGHFFLEVQADMSSRIEARILAGEQVSDGERGIVEDMNTVLAWFGVQATPEFTAIQEWSMRTLDERREAHENFARGFERYAMEGKAPTQELQGIFSKFRSWLLSIYKTLKSLNVELTADVRAVFDRMLASNEAIQEAQDARNMGPLFASPEAAGMTPEEFARYQALGERAAATAEAELDTRLMKDMKWLSRARLKAMKAAQAEANELRLEVQREVRAEVMTLPVYQAWQVLTGKGASTDDRATAEKPKGRSASIDPAVDNLFEAIAKLGGLDKAQAVEQWGVEDKLESGIFGKPVLRATDGLGIDAMAERLVEEGYILPGRNGQTDTEQLESLFDDQRRGVDRYSLTHEYAASQEEAPIEAVDLGQRYAKLNTEELKRRYGDKPDAIWRILSKRRMTNAEGFDPDIVAESIPGGGYTSGDQMIRELVAARPPSEVIAELTDERMLQRYGDITSPAALSQAADEAVHNELRARVIASELKALQKAGSVKESGDSLYVRGAVDVMAKAASEYADQVIARQRIRDLRPKQYAAAEARSAKLAEKSLGNVKEAAMHKRNQLINNYAVKSAYEAQKEVKRGTEFFRKVVSGAKDKVSKTRDFDMVMAARAVLAEYGIGTKGEAANSYLESMKANDPGTYQVLRDKIDALTQNAKSVSDLTVEEFRGLEEEIRGLWFMAKRSRQVEIDGVMVDVERAKMDLTDRMEALGIPARVPGEGRAVTDAERRLTKLQTARAALRRVESWVGAMDGSQGIGPFRKLIWQPIKEAADRYRADKSKYIKAYRDLLVGLDVGKSRIEAPELGYTFGYSRGGSGKAEILHAILHTGNASNKRKLLLGRNWATQSEEGAVDTGKWDRFVTRMIAEGVLTKQDFDFAQGVWDLLDSMKPLAQKAHRDVFGRYFDEVTADAFTVELPVSQAMVDGQAQSPRKEVFSYRGGYVPAMMDSEVVKDAQTRSIQEDEIQTLAYAFPTTSKGFTKSRTEINKPLLLDLRSLSQHIDKVLLFSHMEQPIRDLRKILSSNEVSEPLHRLDPTAYDGILTPWLNRAARQTVETKIAGDNNMMRFFSVMRSRAGMAAMFANFSNTAQQITGLSIAAVKVKPVYLMDAAAQYIRSPRQMARSVAENSVYMAGRMENEVAHMSGQIDEILLNPNLYEKSQAWAMKHAYFMQSAVDNMVGPVVWVGAYNQALEAGYHDRDAIRLADSAVRETQGSTLPEDVSRFETGNAFSRMFTQFAGYFNMQANLLGTEFAKAQHELGLRKGAGKGLYIFTLGFLVPAMVSELIVQAFRGGPDDEEKDGSTIDDWLMKVLVFGNVRAGLGMVPLVGPVLNAGVNTFNNKPYDDRISTSPAISMIESAVSAPSSVYQAAVGDGNARKAIRDTATLISMSTGLPANAIARPAGYLADVAQGRTKPTSAGDALRGMVTGAASPESKN